MLPSFQFHVEKAPSLLLLTTYFILKKDVYSCSKVLPYVQKSPPHVKSHHLILKVITSCWKSPPHVEKIPHNKIYHLMLKRYLMLKIHLTLKSHQLILKTAHSLMLNRHSTLCWKSPPHITKIPPQAVTHYLHAYLIHFYYHNIE